MNKVVALVGMCGSGKSVCCEVFQKRGWGVVYFGGVTMTELEKRGLERNEANERAVREELRRTYGPAAFAILLRPVIREKLKEGPVCLDGLYSWSEYKILREELGEDLIMAAVVTDRATRYERISRRPVRPLTPEQALSRDVAEIENMEKGGPIAMADVFLTNNGSMDALTEKVNALIDAVEARA